MDTFRKYWPLLGAVPFAFGIYFVVDKVNPDTVCEYRLDRQAVEVRLCMLEAAQGFVDPKECWR